MCDECGCSNARPTTPLPRSASTLAPVVFEHDHMHVHADGTAHSHPHRHSTLDGTSQHHNHVHGPKLKPLGKRSLLRHHAAVTPPQLQLMLAQPKPTPAGPEKP